MFSVLADCGKDTIREAGILRTNHCTMKKIIIFGGSGFIGKHLIKELGDGYEIVIPSRDPSKHKANMPENTSLIEFKPTGWKDLGPLFEEAGGIVNLAGEPVSGKWTERKKRDILFSRLNIDRIILKAFEVANHRIGFVIQGSGMGVYGFSRMNVEIDEESQLGRHGFLRRVGCEHEQALHPLEDKTRLVYIRTGLVLDGKEGALPLMVEAFKYKLGGTMGSGKQWISWIHIKDEVRAIRFLIENEKCRGPYNLTAPNAVRQKEFAKALGKALKSPAFMKTPSFLLRIMLGKRMANELLLKGLNIKPKRLTEQGFTFRFNKLEEALSDIYKTQVPEK